MAKKKASKKKATARRSKTRAKASGRKAMKVVSLKSALHMVKRAERAIAVRGIKRKNPLKHFPKMPGRGRPEKERTFEITTVLHGGAVAQRKVKGTWGSVAKGVNRIMQKRHKTSSGMKAVKEILVDDGR